MKFDSFFLIKLASRPGRKAKNKPTIIEDPISNGNLEEKNINEGQNGKNEFSSLSKDIELINFNQDILNSLVSPLRKDFVFGE